MQYSYAIEIPANTLKNASEITVCKLTYGTITKVTVAFPPGPKGLTHITIYHYAHQVWPTNPGGSFAWDNYVIEFNSEFRLETSPYTLKIHAWNLDDTYPHTVTVGFNISRGEYGIESLLMSRMPQVVEEEG